MRCWGGWGRCWRGGRGADCIRCLRKVQAARYALRKAEVTQQRLQLIEGLCEPTSADTHKGVTGVGHTDKQSWHSCCFATAGVRGKLFPSCTIAKLASCLLQSGDPFVARVEDQGLQICRGGPAAAWRPRHGNSPFSLMLRCSSNILSDSTVCCALAARFNGGRDEF